MKTGKENFDYSNLYKNTGNQPPKQEGTPNYGSGSDLERMLEEQLRSVGRAVDEGVSYGFAKMNRVFEDTDRWERVTERLAFAADRMSSQLDRTISHAFDAYKEKSESKADPQAQKNSQIWRKLRSSATKRRVLGIVLSFWCGLLAVGMILPMLVETSFIGGFAVMAGLALLGLCYGVENLRFARFAREFAGVAEGKNVFFLDYLAGDMNMPERKLRKLVQRYLNRGWLTAWLDKGKNTLYMDLADWRAAREEQTETAKEEQHEAQQTQTADATNQADAEQEPLAKLENFVEILAKESCMMADDAQAVQELKELEKTSRAILSWTQKHPESLPKIRHLTEQYIPLTLKLLYTYNDLKLHDGDNAAHVRKDIAGMLHSLNLGFSALQDKLLDEVAMDVTGDIAALQGMLAWDGLSEDTLFQEKPGQ